MRKRRVALAVLLALVLLPALAITAARLLDPANRLGIALVSVTPLALPLYAVALLVALVRLLVVRRRRDLALPVALVAVAGLVLHGWWYAPQVTGANPPPADGATPLVVMTANLRMGDADGIEVVRAASEEHVDLLVLEELTPQLLAEMDAAGLADLLPHRVGEAAPGAHGTMAFSRQPLGDAHRVPTVLGSWSFTMGDLRVLGVHPAYPMDRAGWVRDQATLQRVADEQHPDLMLGDFNATADHAPMRALADAGYRDVGELANDGWHPTWPADGSFTQVRLPLVQIDHVLVGPHLAAIGMHTVEVPGSDHRAVVAEIAPK